MNRTSLCSPNSTGPRFTETISTGRRLLTTKQIIPASSDQILHVNHMIGSDPVSPAGISTLPNVFDQLKKCGPTEAVFTKLDVCIGVIYDKWDVRSAGIFADQFFYRCLGTSTFWILPKIQGIIGKRKPAVQIPDKAGVSNTVDGPHQVTNIFRTIDGISRKRCGHGLTFRLPGNFGYLLTKHGRKEKVVLQKEHIRFDVKKSKCHLSMAHGVKG